MELPQGWSVDWSAGAGEIAIDAARPPVGPGVRACGVRVGPVLLDIAARQKGNTLLVHLKHRQGPEEMLRLRLPPPGPGMVTVDGVTLQGREVRFRLSGEHEVVAYY